MATLPTAEGPALILREFDLAERLLYRPFGQGGVFQESDCDNPRAGLGVKANMQGCVAGDALVLLLRRITQIAAGIKPRVLSVPFAANLERSDFFAVQTHLKLMRFGKPSNVFPGVSLQANSDFIFAVGREILVHRDSASGAEGQIFARAIVLHEIPRKCVGVRHRLDLGVSDGQTSNLARGRQILFQHER